MLNKIKNSPVFTSKVYISAYANADNTQRKLLNSRDFLRDLNAIKNNGEDDILTITPDSLTEDIFINLTEKNANSAKTAETILLQNENIRQVYSDLKDTLKGKNNVVISDPIIDYLI